MEETFGQRLSRIRKEKGLTQEDIAKRIVISPQAVSKWENDISSPDILVLSSLADILGVTVDELLGRSTSSSNTSNNNINKEEENTSSSSQEESSGSQEESTDSSSKEEEKKKDKKRVNIGPEGIHVYDDGEEVHIDSHGIHVTDRDGNSKTKNWKKEAKTFWITQGTCMGLALIGYLLFGLLWTDQYMGWKMGWVLFFIPPIVSSIIEAVRKKRICHFAYPLLVGGVYLTLGFLGSYLGFEGWGFYWFLFITIPAFYLIFGPIDSYIHRHDFIRDDDNVVINADHIEIVDDEEDDDD